MDRPAESDGTARTVLDGRPILIVEDEYLIAQTLAELQTVLRGKTGAV